MHRRCNTLRGNSKNCNIFLKKSCCIQSTELQKPKTLLKFSQLRSEGVINSRIFLFVDYCNSLVFLKLFCNFQTFWIRPSITIISVFTYVCWLISFRVASRNSLWRYVGTTTESRSLTSPIIKSTNYSNVVVILAQNPRSCQVMNA